MSNDFWLDIDEGESTLSPFYVWGEKPCRIFLDKAINEYKTIEIESTYGSSTFVELKIWSHIDTEFLPMKIKVDSKRLRAQLVAASKLKLPVVIDLKREGTGYATQYSFVEVKAPHQTKLDKKKS
ncbi:MAG: hypothetical protein ACFFKA_05805 [Candidatus Thorarchaeota archaeon]